MVEHQIYEIRTLETIRNHVQANIGNLSWSCWGFGLLF